MLTALNAVVLTATEKTSGYTSNAQQGGPDVSGIFTSVLDNLNQASGQLTALVSVLPAGANKTALQTALATLIA